MKSGMSDNVFMKLALNLGYLKKSHTFITIIVRKKIFYRLVSGSVDYAKSFYKLRVANLKADIYLPM